MPRFVPSGMRRPDRDAEAVGDPVEQVEIVELVAVEDRAQVPVRYVKLAVAAAALIIVAVVGLNLVPTDGGPGVSGAAVPPSPSRSPAASPSASRSPAGTLKPSSTSPSVLDSEGELAIGRDEAVVMGVPLTFEVLTSGWSGSAEFGAVLLGRADAFLLFHSPDRVYADPCTRVLGPPVGPSAADLAAALTTIRGIDATGPTDVTVGGRPAEHVVLAVREDVDCAAGPFYLWNAAGPPRNTRLGTTIRVWIVEVRGERLFIEAETRSDAGPEVEPQIQQLIDSIALDVAVPQTWRPTLPPELPPAGAWSLPSAGELAPGWYAAAVDSDPSHSCCSGGFGFLFSVPTSGWVSSGPGPQGKGGYISKGTAGSPDGAVIRFSNPDRVYAEPCAHTLGPPVGPSVANLAAAVARIPGIDVSGPSGVRLRYSTAEHLVLTVRDDIECDPQDFHLWYDEVDGPRSATALGSTIRVWIFNPNDRPVFGRIFIEAETYEGASPEIEREIQQIVDSIDHGG